MSRDELEPSVHRVVDGASPWVRRRIVVWRRLEPGDVRTAASLNVPESPFLEAKVEEIAIPAAVHARMKELAAAKAKATEIPRSPMTEYEPAGVLISGAGGVLVGVWLEYLRPEGFFLTLAAIAGVAGLVLAVVAKQRRAAAEQAAQSRWASAAEREEHDEIARDVAQGWLRLSQALRKERGFHTEIRVAEGSNDPLRLASIDPRPMEGARGFDPEDWLPTEGGGVRYEALHAGGEIATRLMPGATEVEAESAAGADAKADADADADADAKADADAEADESAGAPDEPSERPSA